MTLEQIQVLIELDAGEFHAFQCERARADSYRHKSMMGTFNQLIAAGYIRLVGDHYMVTVDGQDALDAVRAAHIIPEPQIVKLG